MRGVFSAVRVRCGQCGVCPVFPGVELFFRAAPHWEMAVSVRCGDCIAQNTALSREKKALEAAFYVETPHSAPHRTGGIYKYITGVPHTPPDYIYPISPKSSFGPKPKNCANSEKDIPTQKVRTYNQQGWWGKFLLAEKPATVVY